MAMKIAAALIAFSFLLGAQNSSNRGEATAKAFAPAYNDKGELLPNADYRQWIFLTSGFDMSYRPNATSDHSMFDNVFVNPEAYQFFLKNGTWPDKTVLVLEARGAGSKASINKNGHFQTGDVMGVEVHVKDEARFPGKWAFFGFDEGNTGKLIPQTAPCYSCHQEHGAVDTTFVQFYPTLLNIAKSKKTLRADYLKEETGK